MIRESVSRIVRGQGNIRKMAFCKVLDRFQYMTEFATDKWFCLLFPKEKQVEPKVNPDICSYTTSLCLKHYFFSTIGHISSKSGYFQSAISQTIQHFQSQLFSVIFLRINFTQPKTKTTPTSCRGYFEFGLSRILLTLYILYFALETSCLSIST